ncbi:MAG: hypothetical protein J1F41_11390 [Lachnospiraceae bacterium]|nr:hypothetical protein [Lachnospiraceae bacterium]
MKKELITCVIIAVLLTGCGTSSAGKTGDIQNTETYTEGANLKQAGLGGLTALYDDSVWTYTEEQGSDSSLAFEDANGSILGISCSKEGFYQHPLDMIGTIRMVTSPYAGYQETEEPTEVEVQGNTWYEWVYQYEENGKTLISLNRLFGKNYYAYVLTYVAEQDAYDAGRNEALKVMNSVIVEVEDNTQAEEKAQEFLAGEWDLGNSGYLVMNEDWTYAWYMDSSKDEKNMHKGTYRGDVSNSTMGFEEGEGIYLVLFPEVLYVNGEAGQTSNAKYDYGITMTQQADGNYQMINSSTFAMYNMKRQ